MSAEAQAALRRTMETAARSCRFILCCHSLAGLMRALQSRCHRVRVPSPSTAALCDMLRLRGSVLPDDALRTIAATCHRDAHRAALQEQAVHAQTLDVMDEDDAAAAPASLLLLREDMMATDWEWTLARHAAHMVQQSIGGTAISAKQVLQLRTVLAGFASEGVAISDMIVVYAQEVCARLPDGDMQSHMDVCAIAAKYEHRMHVSRTHALDGSLAHAEACIVAIADAVVASHP